MQNVQAKDLLTSISVKFNGDFDKCYALIKSKEKLTTSEIEQGKQFSNQAIVLIGNDYPEEFKSMKKPPIVIFFQGDKSLLNNSKKAFVLGQMSAKFMKGLVKKGYTLVTTEDIKDESLRKKSIIVDTCKDTFEGYALRIEKSHFWRIILQLVNL